MYTEDDIVEIVFAKSAENNSYIFTKNQSRELHEKHLKQFIGEKPE